MLYASCIIVIFLLLKGLNIGEGCERAEAYRCHLGTGHLLMTSVRFCYSWIDPPLLREPKITFWTEEWRWKITI